jgi:hypothetical protein
MTGSNQELSAWIGADGSFLFPEVPPGTYAIRPQPFNEPFTVSLPEGKVIADPPTIVVGETDVSDVVVALYGRLAVRVVVDQGGPAPAFTMTFTENNGPPIQAFPSTAGLYEVTLPPTSYQVAVSDLAEGYSLKSVINGSVDLLRAPLVMNSASNLIVVTLGVSNPPPWVNVSGRLSGLERGDNGETLISLYSEKAGLEYKSILRRDGAFEFQRVVPGIYGVWIEPEPAGIPAIKITVPRRDLRVEITLPPRVPVSGKVAVDHGGTLPTSPVALTEIGRPPASGPVEIVPYRRNLPLEPDGSFSTVLPVGEYRAEPPRGGPFTARGFVDETSGKALADSITVTGSKSKDISIALSVATFPVKGRVRSTDSRLIEGLNAVLEGTGLIDAQNAPLNADGTVEFPNVPPGAYVIRINEGLPADFSVDGNGNQTLDFMMLRGKAIFPAGAPIPQLALTFLPNPSAQSRSLFAHPTIRADGSFEIVLPSADYRVAVAGYFANYALKMYRNGKAAERQDDLMFTISAQDDIELEATFLEPKP